MAKLDEVQKLVDALEIGWLIEPDWDGTVQLNRDKLTPFGRFIISLERVLQRDDELVKKLTQRINGEKNG